MEALIGVLVVLSVTCYLGILAGRSAERRRIFRKAKGFTERFASLGAAPLILLLEKGEAYVREAESVTKHNEPLLLNLQAEKDRAQGGEREQRRLDLDREKGEEKFL